MNIVEIFAFATMLLSFSYVISNIIMQHIAENKLEILLKKHRQDMIYKLQQSHENKISYQSKIHLEGNEFDTQIILMLLKEQIEMLKGRDKHILKKTFDRKDTDNQIRYAIKLFTGSGLVDFFELKHHKHKAIAV